MASNRTQENESKNKSSLKLQEFFSLSPPARTKAPPLQISEKDFIVLEGSNKSKIKPPPCPQNFPKEFKFVGDFKPLPSSSTTSSSHKGYYAIRDGKKFYVKFNEIDPSIPHSDKMPEVESICWRWYAIVDRSIVPQHTYPLYDYDETKKTYSLVGVASELLPNFVPNRDDPLKEEDLIIEALDKDYGHQRSEFINKITALSKVLIRENDNWWDWSKETCNYYGSSFNYFRKPSASWLKPCLDNLIEKNKKQDISKQDICDLLTLLNDRESSAPDRLKKLKARYDTKKTSEKEYLKTSKKYDHENELLRKASQSASLFLNLKQDDHADITKLEKMDRLVRKMGTNLQERNANEKISADINGQPFEMKVSDLINYRTIKAEATSISLSYINWENDNHNRNNGKKGRVDFDMSEWPFVCDFKNPNWFVWFNEWASATVKSVIPDFIKNLFVDNTDKNNFTYHPDDINSLPNLTHAQLRYCPAKSAFFIDSRVDPSAAAAPFYENLYRSEDTIPFQKINSNPIFDFHKFKTFLKSILTPNDMFLKAAELEARNDASYKTKNETKNLIESMVKYKLTNMQNLREVLVAMPTFQSYLEKYNYYDQDNHYQGNHVFDFIKEDFAEEQKALKLEIDAGETQLQDLYNAMKFDEIAENFNFLRKEAASKSEQKARSSPLSPKIP